MNTNMNTKKQCQIELMARLGIRSESRLGITTDWGMDLLGCANPAKHTLIIKSSVMSSKKKTLYRLCEIHFRSFKKEFELGVINHYNHLNRYKFRENRI